jgi:hypothetical protein
VTGQVNDGILAHELTPAECGHLIFDSPPVLEAFGFFIVFPARLLACPPSLLPEPPRAEREKNDREHS